jgi:integrase/recombinase XerC
MDPTTPARVTVVDAMARYLGMVKLSRSRHTMLAYRSALRIFRDVLEKNHVKADATPVSALSEDLIAPLAAELKAYSPATEQLYLQGVKGFFEYIDAERLADINQARIRVLIRQRSRRPGVRFPQFPMDEIEQLLSNLGSEDWWREAGRNVENPEQRLRALRDCAFLFTLADTGLRVHEACDLRRGDLNWNEGYAVVIGKGDKQAVVRFTTRSLAAIRVYLSERSALDGKAGRPLTSLPLFARHDKGAGTKIKPMTPTTGRNIVKERVTQLLGEEMAGKITPHSFRHYFVTSVLRGTGNLRIAQELARHSNIQVTQRYTHLSNDELDKAYHEVFEERSARER